jgi:hypothetical protein
VERVVNTTRSFEKAAEWDVQQQVALTARQRMRIARELKERAYPSDAKDVRACHRN